MQITEKLEEGKRKENLVRNKICKKCGSTLFIPNGKYTRCGPCTKEQKSSNYKRNKKNIRASNDKWMEKNKERYQEIKNRYAKSPKGLTAAKRNRLKHPDLKNADTAKRRACKLQRTPKWLTEEDFFLIREIYSLAKLREELIGSKWHVDHIIPLNGKLVSGLHVPNNLQVILATENLRKSNQYQ